MHQQEVKPDVFRICLFHKDADWVRVEKETEASGKLRSTVTAYKLTPTDFSALK